MTRDVTLIGLPDIPAIRDGDDLTAAILAALERAGLSLEDGDVIVVTQKIVSKAEGCVVNLRTVEPGPQAQGLALAADKDPRLVELILRESRGVVRQREGTLICETHHGWICANAGVDRSNVDAPEAEMALTLPRDPDASARRIRDGLMAATGRDVAVIITDSHGRAWRLGSVNLAIGVAGMLPLSDFRGRQDLFGYTLHATIIARADELAAAAGLVSGQAAEGLPVVLIRGAEYVRGEGRAVDLQRPVEKDLFR